MAANIDPPGASPPAEERLRALYDAFNARDVDSVLAAMTEDVYELRDGLVTRMDVEE